MKAKWLWCLPLSLCLSACHLWATYVPPPKVAHCSDNQDLDDDLTGCKVLAAQGSAQAMVRLGEHFDRQGDVALAYDWYRKAAEWNDGPTIRKLYNDYKSGVRVPRNTSLSEDYLNKAVNLKADWALMVAAKRNETTDPAGAMSTYLSLARANNCFAQARVSIAYFKGDLVERNAAQAYFWGLLAAAAADSRKSDYHADAGLFADIVLPNQNTRFVCNDVKSILPQSAAEALLTPQNQQMVQNAATQWQPGLTEQLFPAPEGKKPAMAGANDRPPSANLPEAAPPEFPPPNPGLLHGHPAPDTIAVIIGIDEYENAPRASFAERDASAFRSFAATSLGLADDNVKVLLGHGARRLDVERALSTWLPSRLKAGQSSIIVYFAGHGLATDDGSDLYLLPYDGDRELLNESAIRRERLIERLKTAGAKHVTLILDTCFSGLSRDGDALTADSRPIVLTPKAGKVDDTVTILSTAQGNQVSLALKSAGHGLYSYMLMKGLEGPADANHDQRITAAELHAYALNQVSSEAAKMGRKQTPVLDGDGETVLAEW